MIFRSLIGFRRRAIMMATISLLLSVAFLVLSVVRVPAQKKYSQNFPVGQSVRLQLCNRSGTVTVEGWDRPSVSISAFLDSPAATITPQIINGMIVVDLVRDNSGRGEVGNVSFTIRVPYNMSVDIETRIGDLAISNVRTGLVRAHISTEGDITLTNVIANNVSAENVTGDIFFDGDLLPNGNYRFTSMQGRINLRIPFASNFKFMATAPSTRSINLNSFSNANLRYLGDGRRVMGQQGDGSAVLTATNQRGIISFFPR